MPTPNLIEGNAVVGQGGGPTAVINQSLVGVIEGLRDGLGRSGAARRIYGMRHGVNGLVKGNLADLSGTAEIATGDGAVVTLTVDIAGAPGTTGIAISEAIATDRSATPVALGSSEGTFTVH